MDSTYTADHYFQDLAKEMHEQNKSNPNVYEHLDTEQYNWAFDIEMEEQTKELVDLKAQLEEERKKSIVQKIFESK